MAEYKGTALLCLTRSFQSFIIINKSYHDIGSSKSHRNRYRIASACFCLCSSYMSTKRTNYSGIDKMTRPSTAQAVVTRMLDGQVQVPGGRSTGPR